MRGGVTFTIGAVVFAVVQVIWSLGHTYSGWRGAWVMKSALGIAFCFAVFVIAGALVIAYRRKPAELPKRAGHLWLGAMAALVVALLIIGPGNIWPLVVALDGAIIGGGVVIGAVIGAALGGKHEAHVDDHRGA